MPDRRLYSKIYDPIHSMEFYSNKRNNNNFLEENSIDLFFYVLYFQKKKTFKLNASICVFAISSHVNDNAKLPEYLM